MPLVSQALGQVVLRAYIFSENAGQLLLRHARADVYERRCHRSHLPRRALARMRCSIVSCNTSQIPEIPYHLKRGIRSELNVISVFRRYQMTVVLPEKTKQFYLAA